MTDLGLAAVAPEDIPVTGMGAALRLLLGLLILWVSCWLGLGLLFGQPLLLLHPLQAPESLRVVYLLLLYGGLVALLAWRWRREPPRIHWGSPTTAFGIGALGVVFVCLQRLCLGSAWQPVWPSSAAWASALLLAFPIAAVEEGVFRGYLYGSLRHRMRPVPAALAVSLFFALVHLFRPGGLQFKLAFALGLVLVALLLALVAELGGLWSAAALHSSLIMANVLDPPGHVLASWWAGLQGEPAAGACSWLLLVVLAGVCRKVLRSRQSA